MREEVLESARQPPVIIMSKESSALTVEQVGLALDSAGITRFSVEIFCIAGLGWLADGAESAVLSYMLPSLMNHWHLGTHELGYVGALIAGGQAFGSIFWGALADSVGRRPAFLASVGLTALLGMICAAAPTLAWYVVLRFVTGFAIGGNLPLAISVASELLPPAWRDRALVALHLFYEAGALSSTALALNLMPESCAAVNVTLNATDPSSVLGSASQSSGPVETLCLWRAYLFFVALPAAVIFPVALVRLPESPFWLASRGQDAKAERVLQRAMGRGRNFQPLDLPEPGRRIPPSIDSAARDPNAAMAPAEEADADAEADESGEAVVVVDASSTQDSHSASSARRSSSSRGHNHHNHAEGGDATIVSGTSVEVEVAAESDMSGAHSTSSWSATQRFKYLLCDEHLRYVTPFVCLLWLFADMASGWWTWTPTFATMQHVDQKQIYIASMLGRVVASCSFVVATIIIDKVGARRLLLLTLLATCGLSAALMIWVNDVALFSSASFVVVYAVFSLFFGGAWPVMYVVTPASFPTSMRGVGFGLASASGKVGTLLGPLIIGAVLAPDIIRIGTFLTILWAAAALSLVVAWRNQNRAAMRP